MVLNADFREFIKSLNENEVKYLVVGGYAVAHYGYPRYTKDLDFWVWAEKGNSERIIQSIKDFGFESLQLVPQDFLNPDNIIQLGYPPNRIDLITYLSGVDFNSCFDKRQMVNIDGLNVNFISIEDLLENKKKTGRHQDLADIEKLKRKQKRTKLPPK